MIVLTIKCPKCGKSKEVKDIESIRGEIEYIALNFRTSCCDDCYAEYDEKRNQLKKEYDDKIKKLAEEYLGK